MDARAHTGIHAHTQLHFQSRQTQTIRQIGIQQIPGLIR
uniref:Uncharacterized protein n=1 Tax=Anguilla anguilla TaxID=7936 RepID=A0A0E9TJ47_ANGAN